MIQRKRGMDLGNHSIITRQYIRKMNPHDNREKTNHRDGRIPGRIYYPTTAADIPTHTHQLGESTFRAVGSVLSTVYPNIDSVSG